jgi:hypothetical protein
MVDELFLDELLAIVNCIEHFTGGQRRCGVLPNQAKACLQFRGSWIFEPKQMKRLEFLARARSLDGSRPVMRVVQQMHIGPKLLAQSRKELRHKIQVLLRRPTILQRQAFFRGLVLHLPTADAIGALEPWNSRLRANGFVSKLQVMRDSGDRIFDVGPARVPIHQHSPALRHREADTAARSGLSL